MAAELAPRNLSDVRRESMRCREAMHCRESMRCR